jgi:hypothetical protein
MVFITILTGKGSFYRFFAFFVVMNEFMEYKDGIEYSITREFEYIRISKPHKNYYSKIIKCQTNTKR